MCDQVPNGAAQIAASHGRIGAEELTDMALLLTVIGFMSAC